MTDGEHETAVSASLQKIKSIKNQHKHFFFSIFYFFKSQTIDSFVNHFDGHFAYLKTLNFSFKCSEDWQPWSWCWGALFFPDSCTCFCWYLIRALFLVIPDHDATHFLLLHLLSRQLTLTSPVRLCIIFPRQSCSWFELIMMLPTFRHIRFSSEKKIVSGKTR